MPHGHCILWKPQILIPIVASDIVIFLSYISIPFFLYKVYKKRPDIDDSAKKLILLFVLFILFCGITHYISAYNYWNSEYVLEMFFKVLTASVSLATAIAFYRLVPAFISLPTPKDHQKVINELKQVNQRLEKRVAERTHEISRQKELLDLLVRGHNTGVVQYYPVLDDEGKVIDFSNKVYNNKALSMLGLDRAEDLETESILTKYPEVLETGHYEAAVRAFETGDIVIEDPVHAPWFNRFLRISIFRNPVDDSLFVCYSDVTERENAKLKTVAQSKLAALGELAGGIAHEINSPLQVISGKVRKIKREMTEKSNKDLISTFEEIDETLISVRDIITNLKKLSSHEDKKSSVFEVNDVLLDTIQFYNKRSQNNNVEIRFKDNESKDINVFANKTALFQIMSNLINNAIDSLLEKEGERFINIVVIALKENLEIRVLDNGPRISPQIAENIFDPLFTTKEIGKGTGLGLSLSSKLAEGFGSTLSLVQDEEKYFKLVIPNKDKGEAL